MKRYYSYDLLTSLSRLCSSLLFSYYIISSSHICDIFIFLLQLFCVQSERKLFHSPYRYTLLYISVLYIYYCISLYSTVTCHVCQYSYHARNCWGVCCTVYTIHTIHYYAPPQIAVLYTTCISLYYTLYTIHHTLYTIHYTLYTTIHCFSRLTHWQ